MNNKGEFLVNHATIGGNFSLDFWRWPGRRERYAWHLIVTTEEGGSFTLMGESRKPPNCKEIMQQWAAQHNLGPVTFPGL